MYFCWGLDVHTTQISLHFTGHNQQYNKQNGQEERKTNEQYVVLPGYPFYGCQVHILKHTAGYCTIQLYLKKPYLPSFLGEVIMNYIHRDA